MPDQQKRQTPAQDFFAGSQPENSATLNLAELMYRFLESWKLIVCLILLFAVAAGLYTKFVVTPMYQATSTIYVLSRRDSAINIADLQIGTALTQDYIKVFKMWEVHEEVKSNLNLPYSYTKMRSMLSVVNESDTRMLDINVTSEDPQEAADIANEYAKVASQYIADTMSTDKPNIMSVALTPSNPVSPSMTKNISLGFLLGLILALGIVTVRLIMDDKYKTAEDIRRYTGLATLAMIPIETEGAVKNKDKAKRARRSI